MTALLELAPERIVKVFITIIRLITGLFCFAVAVLGWRFTQLAFSGGQVSPALLVPIWPVYVAVPIGLFLTGIQYMRIFFENLFGQK